MPVAVATYKIWLNRCLALNCQYSFDWRLQVQSSINVSYCNDDDATSGEKETDDEGEAAVTAAESQDVTNSDAISDTYVDTLNLWV